MCHHRSPVSSNRNDQKNNLATYRLAEGRLTQRTDFTDAESQSVDSPDYLLLRLLVRRHQSANVFMCVKVHNCQ